MAAVGIDFGTANALVAISHNGQVEVIEHDDGRQLACCVAFTNTERLVGQSAIHQMPTNPENTVYRVKPLLGRGIDKIKGIKAKNLWQFEVKADESHEKPIVLVKYKKDQKKFYPEEIASVILSKLKQIAEKRLKEITAAVITVPSSFNYEQRKATIDAAKIAGIPNVLLVNETTAVAFDCCLREETTTKKKVFIFRLGGGSANVAVVEMEKKTIKVISTEGINIGGEDFTLALFNHVVDDFTRNRIIGLKKDKKAICRLWLACEQAKKDLSISDVARIKIDSLLGDKSCDLKVKREKFQEITKDLVSKLVQTAKNVANEKKIDSVYFVGGATRTPHFQKAFLKTFKVLKNKVLKTVNVNEAAALGAARLAEMMFRGESQDHGENAGALKHCGIQDILSYSIHLDFGMNSMKKVFDREISIPTSEKHSDCHAGCVIKAKTDDDTLRDIVFHDRSQSQNSKGSTCHIYLEIDENGILDVVAQQNLKLDGGHRGIRQDKLKELIQKARDYEKEEKMQKRFEQQLHEFQYRVFDQKSQVTENHSLTFKEREDFENECQKIHDWIQTTEEIGESLSKEITRKKSEFEELVKGIKGRLEHKSPTEKGIDGSNKTIQRESPTKPTNDDSAEQTVLPETKHLGEVEDDSNVKSQTQELSPTEKGIDGSNETIQRESTTKPTNDDSANQTVLPETKHLGEVEDDSNVKSQTRELSPTEKGIDGSNETIQRESTTKPTNDDSANQETQNQGEVEETPNVKSQTQEVEAKNLVEVIETEKLKSKTQKVTDSQTNKNISNVEEAANVKSKTSKEVVSDEEVPMTKF